MEKYSSWFMRCLGLIVGLVNKKEYAIVKL